MQNLIQLYLKNGVYVSNLRLLYEIYFNVHTPPYPWTYPFIEIVLQANDFASFDTEDMK
jgi:hypothetical protein